MKKFSLMCFLFSLSLLASAQTLEQNNISTGNAAKVLPLLTSSDAPSAQTGTQNKAFSGNEVPLEVRYPEYWPDRVFIKLKDNQSVKLDTYETKASRLKAATGNVNTTLRRFESSRVTELPRSAKLAAFKNTYEVVVDKPEQLNLLLSELNTMPEVAYAERVPLYYTSSSPNDPMKGQQYALNKINASGAAEIHTGTSKTLLAIVDDAVLISHPDLQANVDASKSYDVADRDNDPRPPAAGTNKATANSFSHGTHCAGIAGAVTNNSVGISAVSNNKISIIGIKCTSDFTADSRLIERSLEGIVYAINQGARVISMSFGGTGTSQTFQSLINEATANGVVFVAAAGNSNNDTKNFPAAYENVIAVASTDASDLKSSFSNYGSWIHVSAPGSAILSTVANGPAGEYISYNGTSMATPMVAGLVALMLSQNPDLTPQAVTQILRATADPIDNISGQQTTLAGKLGTGRINALKAIQAIKDLTPEAAPAAIANLKVSRTGKTEMDLTWTAPATNGTQAATLYDIRYATAPITAANFSSATRTVKSIAPGQPGAPQSLTVGDLAPGTTYYFAIVARSSYGDGSPISNVVNGTTLAAPHIQVNAGTGTTLNINRSNGLTASGTFIVTNPGKEPLTYSLNLSARSGSNVMNHDKPLANADTRFSYGSGSFITAARFVADSRGFNLSQVQNFIFNPSTVSNAAIGVRIYKGGTTPANATLVASQNFATTIPAGGELLNFKLQQAQQLQPGEVFWVAFVLPAGLTLPQGVDSNMGVRPGTFFASSDGGASYVDAQLAANYMNKAAFKIRAVDAGWFTMTPASGTIAAGQSQEVALTADVTTIVNGTYQADILFNSNSPLTPTVSRAVTVTVSGGLPAMVVENPSVDFGTLFVGSGSTGSIVVKNTGVAALTISSATFNTAPFQAGNFAFAPALPFTIQPGTQQQLGISFSPSEKATLAGSVTLVTNAPSGSSAAISLNATMISPPVPVLIAPDMNVLVNKHVATSATKTIKVRNTGEAALEYAVRLLIDPANTIAYDEERKADTFLGFNSASPPLHVAVKFNVTTPRFTLTEVQNYYRSQGTATHDVTVKIYKGGASPAAGTLLLQQVANSPASAGNGGMVTVPLKQQQEFVYGDVFWVVFVHTGVDSPQGVNSIAPPANANYYSTDGNSWTSWTNSTFKIRALGAPSWLSVATGSGFINASGEQDLVFTVDAADLETGNYIGRFELISNNMLEPHQIMALNLQVEHTLVGNPTALHKELVELEGVTVYPNPVEDRFMLEFTVQKPEDLQIRMHSLTGHVILEETHRNYSGTYKQQVNTHKFASGIYILQVQQGEKLFTKKLIIR